MDRLDQLELKDSKVRMELLDLLDSEDPLDLMDHKEAGEQAVPQE